MANGETLISQLPLVSSAASDDELIVNADGTTSRITKQNFTKDSKLNIGTLPPAASFGQNDLFAVDQGGVLKRVQIRGLGLAGETWHDVSALRVSSSTYTNTHGYPIMVNMYSGQETGNNELYLYVNGKIISSSQISSNVNNITSVQGIVPIGGYYIFTHDEAKPITVWELY